MDVEFHSEIGAQHTMIEVMNHIKVLLKSTGRPEYFLFQDDECVTAMNSIPPGEIMGRVHIADSLTKHQQRRRLMPGYFKAAIMSLTLCYPSIDHLQAN